MIAVISDDFTGAAEIAGIAVRNGYTAVIDTTVNTGYSCDVLVIATNTRSISAVEAEIQIKKITQDLLKIKPEFIYKKTDSILRGNVSCELKAQMEVEEKKKVLLIPANPILNRKIVEGIYYINGIPLMESDFFGKDLKLGKSSNVLDMLGNDCNLKATCISLDQNMPDDGINIGNTGTSGDLLDWVDILHKSILPAGGAGFFNAILQKKKGDRKQISSSFNFGIKALYVCGSNYQPSREVVEKAKKSGASVFYMPEGILCENDITSVVESWAGEIVSAFKKNDKIIIAIDKLECKEATKTADEIGEVFSLVVKLILEQMSLDELLIEGGATAYSIMQYLGYQKFYPEQEFSQGVIRMKIEQVKEMYLTLKPGSYQWNEAVWKF